MNIRKIIAVIFIAVFCSSLLLNVYLYKKNLQSAYIFNKVKNDPLGLNDRSEITGDYEFVIFGDSHADNWKNFPYQNINLGIGGQTSAQMLLRVKNQLSECKIKHTVVFCGGNDLKLVAISPVLNEKVLNQYKANVLKILHDLPSENIILVTIPPVFKKPLKYYVLDLETSSKVAVEMNHFLKSLKSERVYVLDADKIFSEQEDLSSYSSDGIHMNEKAYTLLNKEVTKIIKDTIKN